MNPSISKASFLLMSSVLALYVISFTEAAPADTCVLLCMRNVLKCLREENLGIKTTDVPCCDSYAICYLGCKPDATSVPPCGVGSKGKRGSWNKRAQNTWSDGSSMSGYEEQYLK